MIKSQNSKDATKPNILNNALSIKHLQTCDG